MSLHLAIIPDGNRRWAREKGFANVWKGHEKAVENFKTITEWCRKSGKVTALTVWCFSTENWKRDPEEIRQLMTMLEKYLNKEKDGFLKEKTRFTHSGRRDRIPASLKKVIEEVEEMTKDQTEFTLNLAVDYGGKDEVKRAVEKMKGSTDITEQTIRDHLDHPEIPDIDIVLRSSGEQRTSNFALWQTAYAEWIFSPKYFPDIDTKDLEDAVVEFDRRKRRFGK